MRIPRTLILGISVAALAGAGWWAAENLSGPEALVPPFSDNVDPDIAESITDAAATVNRFPGSKSARTKLAYVYESNGQLEFAQQTYEQIIETGEADADTWYRLACTLEKNGNLAGAIQAAETALQLDPDVPWVHWRIGMWLLDNGDLERAERHIDRALELDAADPAVHYARARWMLLNRSPGDEIIRLINEKNLATPTCGRDRGHQPRDFGKALLGSAHRISGNEQEAATLLEGVEDANPTFADPSMVQMARHQTGAIVHIKRGGQLVMQKQYDAALEILEPVLERSENPDTRLYNLVAICLIERGEPDRGLALLTEAFEKDPESFQNLSNLTVAHLRLTNDRSFLRDEVLGHANRAIERRPHYGPAWALRARLHARLGETEKAVADFKRAFEYDASRPSYLVDAGWEELRAQWFRSARRTFEQALAVNNTLGDAQLGIAYVLVAERKLDDAMAALEQADQLGCNPNRRRLLEQILPQGDRSP